jgi:hypothetical protein
MPASWFHEWHIAPATRQLELGSLQLAALQHRALVLAHRGDFFHAAREDLIVNLGIHRLLEVRVE